jgi:hypothetical protein
LKAFASVSFILEAKLRHQTDKRCPINRKKIPLNMFLLAKILFFNSPNKGRENAKNKEFGKITSHRSLMRWESA